MGGLVIVAPHKNVFPERRIKMPTSVRRVRQQNQRFVPGQIQQGERRVKLFQPKEVKLSPPRIKIRKPDEEM